MAIVSIEVSTNLLSTSLIDLGDELKFKVTFSDLILESSSESLADVKLTDGAVESVQYIQQEQDCDLAELGVTIETGALILKSKDSDNCKEVFKTIDQNLTVQFILTNLKAAIEGKNRQVSSIFITLKR